MLIKQYCLTVKRKKKNAAYYKPQTHCQLQQYVNYGSK